MTVALTGASGFTGRYVCAELDSRGIAWHSFDADLTDSEAVERAVADAPPFEAVIHLAAIAFAGGTDWRSFYEVNQLGTLNLVDSIARHRPGTRCVIASSAQVYGSAAAGIIDESHRCDPSNHYGLSKYAMELGARKWSSAIDLVIARPFNYTGVGQAPQYLVPKLVDHFQRRCDVVELGNIHVKRDFGDARAVARIYCELAMSSRGVDLVNVGSGHLYSISELIALLTDITGHHIEVVVNPKFVRPDDVEILGCDTRKLQQSVENAHYPDFKDTLRWMLGTPIQQ